MGSSIATGTIAADALSLRTKTLPISMNSMTIVADGSNNLANIYSGSEGGVAPHEYYLIKTTQTSFQDLTVTIKVKLPEDFVDFTTAANDIDFYYKNTGVADTDSKIDILVEDDDGDDAYTAADGQTLFNTSWTQHLDEFDGVDFDPTAGEYIYITIIGYTSYDSGYQSPYLGEIVLTYSGK